ncbi:MFS transporter [Streptomyces sp. DSM 42041]|uniref:MFS transporter n=1 Tax=Streptomyces hazeniae TaxID=3075538 RepID=A0ABU2NYV0_9ACTN|nr:MFS transporter [Streptomyces sp. DSM 42041]MDT0382166.1 MFS transporter [Streptomyces sp. DSM 42041]
MANVGIQRFKKIGQLPSRFRLLLVASFLIPLGGFMVMPFMSFFLHERLKMDLGTVGVIIAVASFVQMSGGVVGGMVADRFGLKRTMVLALTVRTFSFLLFVAAFAAPAISVPALLLSSAGVALYLPANKAYVVQDCDEGQRPLFLSLTNSALNGGMALGPLISGLFIMRAPLVVFVAVTGIFAGVTLLHIRALPSDLQERQEERASTPYFGGIRTLFIPPVLTAAFGFYIYMFFQNYMSVYALDRYAPMVFSALLLINGVLVIVLQPLMAKRISALNFPAAVALSFALFGVGLLLVAHAGFVAVVGGVILISLGEVVLFLKNELEALRYSPGNPAAVFGNQRLAAGIGAFASASAGGWLYESVNKSHSSDQYFWAYCAAQAAVVGLVAVLVVLFHKGRHSTAGQDDAASEVEQGTEPTDEAEVKHV